MARRIEGISIQLDADVTPLNRALSQVDNASRSTSRELGQINRALRFDEGNQTLLAQRFEVLGESIQNTSTRLDVLRQAQGEVQRQFDAGDIDASTYRDFQRQIEQTESTLRNFQQQARDTEARINVSADTTAIDRVRAELGTLGSAARDAGREIGDGIAAGAAVGVAALGGLAASGQDLNARLGALNASVTNLGFDNTTGQFTDLAIEAASFTGDLEGAIEAVSNLANTPLQQNQIGPVLEQLTGAAVQFRETLNLEGIADGFQETLAIGEGAGTFIEYLERSGISLDTFNEGLAAARASGEDLDFVLGVLSSTNGQATIDTYRELNSELIESQRAQAEFEVATADLNAALLPLLTTLAVAATAVVAFLSENEELTVVLGILGTAISVIVGVFGVLAPIISNVFNVFGSLSRFLPLLARGFTFLTGPIGIVIGVVLTLIGLVKLIIDNWSQIGDFFKTLWDGIGNAFNFVVDNIKKGFSSLVGFAKTPINAIIGIINNLIRGLNKIKLPDFLGGFGVNLPEIPRFARGTNYFRGGAAIVGEEGPELINLPGGSSVSNARDTQRALGGNQTYQINIPVQIDGRVVANATARFTDRELNNLNQQNLRGGRRR